ncbi:MAG: hypothetical protein JW395_0798 [Nitrospira sp.]|nr:hypothetical protein [Nitrospira sp.]
MPSVRLIVTFTAAPGKVEELAALMQPRMAEVRQEPGCLQYELFRGTENADTLVLLERWVNDDAFKAHLVVNATRTTVGADLRVPPRILERYDAED